METSEQHWSSRKQWQNGRIRPQYARLGFVITLIFFVVWTGIALWVYLDNQVVIERAISRFIESGYQQFDEMLFIPLMFLLSLLMLPSLVKTFRRFRMASKLTLNLDPYPGQVGGIYVLSNRLKVDITRDQIATSRSVFGREFNKNIPIDQVVALDKRVTSQTGQGASAKVNYTLYAKTRDGMKYSLGDGVPGHDHAADIWRVCVGFYALTNPARVERFNYRKSIIIDFK